MRKWIVGVALVVAAGAGYFAFGGGTDEAAQASGAAEPRAARPGRSRSRR